MFLYLIMRVCVARKGAWILVMLLYLLNSVENTLSHWHTCDYFDISDVQRCTFMWEKENNSKVQKISSFQTIISLAPPKHRQKGYTPYVWVFWYEKPFQAHSCSSSIHACFPLMWPSVYLLSDVDQQIIHTPLNIWLIPQNYYFIVDIIKKPLYH